MNSVKATFYTVKTILNTFKAPFKIFEICLIDFSIKFLFYAIQMDVDLFYRKT